ncbi:MAG: rhodanese domain-containing protein [Acidobacteria bacterium OLB17]|nr:MAG: rhodanese domain-containing protein [Acidobacteria bacterium OLB17]MCZ2391081.1 lipoprotein [Acidobacteriota bacterium]
MKKFVIFAVFVLALAACNEARTPQTPAALKEPPVTDMTVTEARPGTEDQGSQFIDVRTAKEYAAGHAKGAVNIPLDTLEQRASELKKDAPVYVICETGRRSLAAAEMLNKEGFKRVINITGGTRAWADAGLPMEAPVAGD